MSEEEAVKEPDTKKSPENTTETQQVVPAAKGSSHITLIVMVVCIVAAAVGLIFSMKTDGDGLPSNGGSINNGPNATGNLVDGKAYMIYIRNVEVQPKKANGDDWDSRNSAPDVFYRVNWKKNMIYESDKKKDSLIAEWIPVGLSLKDSILSGKVSVDQAINIPIVKFDKTSKDGDEIIFQVIDSDLVNNDNIEELRVYLSKLSVGDNVYDFRDKNGHGLLKVVVRIIDNSLSTDEKIQALMRGQ